MHLRGIFFLESAVIAGIFSTCPAVSAPSIKSFGPTASSTVRNNIRDNKKATIQSSTTGKKVPTVRVLGATARPASKMTTGAKIVSVTPQKTNSVDSVRTPGLHGNLIKGIGSKLSSNYSAPQSSGTNTNGNSSSLEQRITALETKISTKQDKLESGNGINIEHNTISLSQENANLPEVVNQINQEINSLSEQIDTATLPQNYYTIDQTETYLQQNYYTKQYVDQITNQLANANAMNSFDTDPSANTTYIFKTDSEGNGTWQELQVQKSWNPNF